MIKRLHSGQSEKYQHHLALAAFAITGGFPFFFKVHLLSSVVILIPILALLTLLTSFSALLSRFTQLLLFQSFPNLFLSSSNSYSNLLFFSSNPPLSQFFTLIELRALNSSSSLFLERVRAELTLWSFRDRVGTNSVALLQAVNVEAGTFRGKQTFILAVICWRRVSCLERNSGYMLEFRYKLKCRPQSYWIQSQMSEYRVEFDQDYEFQNQNEDALQHYRLQIAKLEDKLRDEAITYKKRIAELEGELYSNRKPMINQSDKRSAAKLQDNLSYELYEKDLQIRQLKAENVKLRQIINNPDKVLIRKPDHFEAITEKEQEILKLRRTIQEIQGKHDGQFLSQQKLKKENEMLQHEIEELRADIRNSAKYKFGLNQQKIDPELLSALKMRKELEASQKQIVVLHNALRGKDQELLVWRTKYANSKHVGLGVGTQYEEFKLQFNQYRDKNRELNKVVLKLQEENQKLHVQRDRARFSAEQRLPEVARKVQNESQRAQNLMRYHQSRSMAMKSLVPSAEQQVPIAMRKTARYDQFHFSDWESIA